MSEAFHGGADGRAAQQSAFERDLIKGGWVLPTLGEGVVGTGGPMEAVIRGLESLARRRAESLTRPGALVSVRFPPVNGRRLLERTDYVSSFPQLLGTIDTFQGDAKDHRRLLAEREEGLPWDGHMRVSDYSLVPAACHPLYAALELGPSQGLVDGTVYQMTGDCFRNEASADPMRLVSFRMLELVLLGTPEQALAHREACLEMGEGLLRELGLDIEREAANDAFFGRAGIILSRGQREAELKFELTAPVYSDARTAISSGNYHEDHFGQEFGLRTSDGSVAHSACFGFGLERIALALAKTHGTDLGRWPGAVRELLLPRGAESPIDAAER
ncbi:hypothetical protein [Kocuria palustris]|uniref:hypothetical protein n=1 Tax=Kocuria palustris TaxID=71999 RepID=UPI002468ACD0|nr:hypothetical protein [Kocuria palustris]MDH5151652.1 hypothetical protein [Kocuria palustris]